MKLLQLVFIILSILLITKPSTFALAAEANPDNETPTMAVRETPEAASASFRFPMRQLAAGAKTCDIYPQICHIKGSPGPDCCHKKCINVKRDILNCGACGHKCVAQQICCDFTCVNYLTDSRNCGRCNHKCKNGSKCVYGICNYA